LGAYDSETLSAAGLPLAAPYQSEKRLELESLVDSSIQDVFAAQVTSLNKSSQEIPCPIATKDQYASRRPAQ
jgi:hypothetical protein